MRKKINTCLFAMILATMLMQIPFMGSAQVYVDGTKTACDQNNGTATVTNTGVAQPPLIYQWSNGGSEGSIGDLAPGKYTVTITDARGCKGTDQVTIKRERGGLGVTLSPPPGASFVYPCNGTAPKVPLIASATGGLGTITFTPGVVQYAQGNGTFSVSARDQEGFCTGSAEVSITFTPSVCSKDPNEIIGPVGYGEKRFVSTSLKMPYTILFENDPELAVAPAQKVIITHQFDPHINRSSLKLGDFGFSNMIFSIPANTASYSTRLDLRDSLGIFVDLTAGINVGNNTAFWIFQTIDPATGLPPADPFLGFLPVNDSSGKGEGFVSYTVNPRISTQSGDSIKAQASIVFDINTPIITNIWSNVADAGKPQSSVYPLASSYDTTRIQLSFSSQDDAMGSGVASVELWVSENQGGYSRHGIYPPDTTIEFTGSPCSDYRFFSIAIDHAGNLEEDKEEPDAVTTLMPLPVFTHQPSDTAVASGFQVSLTAQASGARFYQWEASNDGGFNYFILTNDTLFTGTSTAVLTIVNTPLLLNGWYFRCIAGNGTCSTISNPANLLILTTLSGRLLYKNGLFSPITNSLISLDDFAGNRIDSTYSNAGGNFYFLDTDPGEYLVKAYIENPWGGVNATDALRILLHFAQQLPLNGLNRLAGDVNNSNSINAVDALLIARRFTAMIDTFPSGNWCSLNDTVSLGSGNVAIAKEALCFGDVDGSYIPALRAEPRISITPGQTQKIHQGEVFELPLISTQELTAGAISLVMTYPENLLHIEDVRLKNPAHAQNLMFTAEKGVLRVAWYSPAGLQIDFRDPLLILKIRASEKPLIGKLDFIVEGMSEVADPKGILFENVRLEAPELISSESADELTLAQNYPNPFRSSTEISYYLPEAGKVSLRVFNPLGQQIATLTDEIQQSGYYVREFNEPQAEAGVYAIQLTFENQGTKKVLYKLMTKAF